MTILRTFVSLISVSLNPGVSTNTTLRPSMVNGLENWTSDVQDVRSVPTLKSSDPLARFANCEKRGEKVVRMGNENYE